MINSGALRAALKSRIESGDPVTAPFVWDPLSARLAATAGCEAVYMTGAGTANSHGYPDVGLLTQSEMAETARAMTRQLDVPLIADADEGFGTPLHVMRTVEEYERAGVSALHIEDQDVPKRPKGMPTAVIPIDSMVAKIKAAQRARNDPNLLIIGRSDALMAQGIGVAIERVRVYFDAGCDMVFIPGVTTDQGRERYATELAGVPKVYLSDPPLTNQQLREYGFALQLHRDTFISTWKAFITTVDGVAGTDSAKRRLSSRERIAEAVAYGQAPADEEAPGLQRPGPTAGSLDEASLSEP